MWAAQVKNSLLVNLTGSNTESGVIPFTLARAGLVMGTMNGWRNGSSVLSFVEVDGIVCASDRMWTSSAGVNAISSASCAKYLEPGAHTARVYTDGSGVWAPWVLQVIMF